MPAPAYKLTELADAAGVTPRTVRYYIAQGLLPSPGRLGPHTRYDAAHLGRLLLIRSLQEDRRLPLADIRRGLEGGSHRLAERAAVSEPPPRAPASIAAGERPGRTRWERIVLTPGVEVHVRRPLPPGTSQVAEQLMTYGRQLVEGVDR